MHTYKVNTGLELSLERKLADMTKERNDGAKRIVELRQEVRELQAQVKALCNQDEAQAEVARLKELLIEREDKWDEAKTNMALMTDELDKPHKEVEFYTKAYNEEHHETQVYKKAWREQQELVALRDDQIAMLERQLAKHADVKEDMEDQTKLVDDLRYHINTFMAAVEETIDL